MSGSPITTFEDMNPDQKIEKGKVKLKEKHPFFGTLVGYLEVIKTDNLPTAGVTEDGKLLYNPEFVDTLTQQETMAILAHEVLHPALGLFDRMKGRDHSISNEAHDLIINYMLVHQNEFELPNSPENFEHTIPDTKNVSEPFKDIIEDEEERIKNRDEDFVLIPNSKGTFEYEDRDIRIEDIDEKNYETVYSELHEQTDGEGISQAGQRAIVAKDGNGNVTISIGGDDYVVAEEDLPYDIEDSDATESGERDWREIVSHAESNARHRGEEPGGLEDLIEADRNDDRIDYEKYIKNQLSNIVPDGYTFKRKSDSGRVAGVYLPDTKKKRSVDLIIAVDTSGSVSDRMLEAFTGEICSICRTFKSVELTVIQHDSEVQDTEHHMNPRVSDLTQIEIKGRGGTDHRPVFEQIEDGNYGRKFFVVCLTDGYTKVPDEIPIRSNRLLWVLDNYEVEMDTLKHGEIARISIDN